MAGTDSRRRTWWLQGGVLVASLAVAGTLFWGVPATSGGELPDAAQMARRGDDRRTSAENVEFWSRRVRSVPTSPGLRTQLAAAHLTLAGDTGDLAGFEAGESIARAAVDLDPGSSAAKLVLAAALAGQHEFAAAFGLAEDVLAGDPSSVAALLAAGDAQLELGNYADARRRYELAARTTGADPAIVSRFARLESMTGTVDAATDLAREALVVAGDQDLRHADAAFYWFQLASYEYRRGAYDRAQSLVDTALRVDPSHGGATELVGKVLVARGEYAAATAAYEAMVEGGGAADLHGELAKLYRRAGRSADADRQIELGMAVAREEADRFPAERRHLIGFLADHDPDEALRLAELDLAERQDVFAHGWHAWALHRTGDHEGAVAAILPALRYQTQDAMLHYHAGLIFAAVEQPHRAAAFLERALELNPEFDLVHAAVARETLASQ